MALPQLIEYNEAIQNSHSAFIDSELRNATNDGRVFMGVPGGPVASGNFAIVYRFRTGSRRLAVKCFTREKTDQQTRYQLIHEHLAAQKLPWMIDFTFIKEGIRVKGKTYPVVKMEWIENAKTLLSHINDTISANQPLDSVCDQFYRMASDLKQHSITHGDLQHANLIISDGKLRLIDYDGMCVPKTAGLPSEEDGLPDYQHPRRHGGTLKSTLDHFSTLVIWTSLHALTIDPTLWRRWVREDERLLFSKADFVRPDNSALIRELLSFRDPKMSSAVEAIVNASAATSLEQVPHLVEVVRNMTSLDPAPWWQPAASTTSGDLFGSQGATEVKTLPAWIASTKASSPPPVIFRGRTPILSLYSALSMAVVLIAVLLTVGGAASASVAFTCVVMTLGTYGAIFHIAFLRRSEVAARSKADIELSAALDQDRKATTLLNSKQAPYLKKVADHERKIASSVAKMKDLELGIETIKNQANERLRSSAHTIAEKRSCAEKAEREALSQSNTKKGSAKTHHDSKLRQIEQELSSAETLFNTQINLLSSQSVRDREAKFDAFIQTEMQKVDMSQSGVSGVNTYALRQYGFNTLADFVGHVYDGNLRHKNGRMYKISGVGSVRGEALDRWRKRKVEHIRLKTPAAVHEAINLVIDAEMLVKRERLESIRDLARTKAENAKAHAKAEYDRTLAEAVKGENEVKQRTRVIAEFLSTESMTLKAQISAEEAAECSPLTRELWTLQSVVNPARHLINSERTKMQSDTFEMRRGAAKASEKFEAAKMEAARYARITHTDFITHVFS